MIGTPKRIPPVAWLVIASALALNARSVALGQDETPARPPDPALRGYLSANGMLNRGLYELAIAEYRAFLADHADHEKAPPARYGLAVGLYRTNRLDEAVTELTALSKQDDFAFAAEVDMILGRCHLEKQRFEEAAKAFVNVATEHPNHALAADAAVGAAEAYYHAHNYAESVKWCDAVARRWPDHAQRARAAFYGGLAAMAADAFSAAAERFALVLDRDPDGAFADQGRLLLAQCHERDNAAEKAIREYTNVLKAGRGPYVADALLALGHLFHRRGDLERSASVLDRLIERFPDDERIVPGRFLRGRVHFERAEYDDAFALFKLVADAPGEAAATYRDQVAYWTAKCLLRNASPGEAAQRLADAAVSFDDSALLPEMLYDLGVARSRTNDVDGAIESWRKFYDRFSEHELAPEALHLMAMAEHQRAAYDRSAPLGRGFLERFADHDAAPAIMLMMGENAFLSGDLDGAVNAYRALLERFPDDERADQGRLRLGTALFRLDRFDEAGAVLEEVVARRGSGDAFALARRLLGDMAFQRGEWKTAQRFFESYVEGGADRPGADGALLKLGLALQRQKEPAEAIEAYDRLIAGFTDSPHRLHAMFERGQALVMLDRVDAARAAFEQVVSDGADSRFAAHAFNHLASLASRRGRYDEAKRNLERVSESTADEGMQADALAREVSTLMAARHFAEAQSTADRFLTRFASHDSAKSIRAHRAIALARQDHCDKAVAAIEQVESAGGAPLDDDQRSALTYEKAWCLQSLGRLDDAASVYRSMIGDGPIGVYERHAMVELGGIEADAGRCQSAVSVLKKVRQSLSADSSPDSPAPLLEPTIYRLGVCAFKLDRFDESAALFEELIAAFPASPLLASASYYAGDARFRAGRFDAAAAHFERIIDRFERDAVFEPALLRLGDCWIHLQRWAVAERTFAKYLNRFADADQWFQAQFGVGLARENQRRYDDAINAYRAVVARHTGPTAARAQFQIGECLFAQDRFADAVRELLKVDILYAYPEWSAAALYESARCFEKMNMVGEAREHFQRVSQKHGDSRWAQPATQRLSELSSASVPGR